MQPSPDPGAIEQAHWPSTHAHVQRVLHTIRTPGVHDAECEHLAFAGQVPVGTSSLGHEATTVSLAPSCAPASAATSLLEAAHAAAAIAVRMATARRPRAEDIRIT